MGEDKNKKNTIKGKHAKTEVKTKIEDDIQKDIILNNKEENKEIIEISKDSERLKELGNVIKKQKETPKEIQEKINKKIYINILIAIFIMIYLIFINIGYLNIKAKNYIIDLQAFSITLILSTIVIWEQAYKKESIKLTIYGIETFFLAIFTMLLPEIYIKHNEIFQSLVAIYSLAFAIYYVAKSIIIYIKLKKNIRKSDVKKIARKV